MRIQRVSNGDLVPVEGLDVPAGTQVHITSEHGAVILTEDPFTGALTIARAWGTITLQDH